MKRIGLLVLFLLLLQPAVWAEGHAERSDVEQGRAHFETGFYRLTPKHRAAEAAREYALAIRAFKQAIAADPENEAAYRHLARVYEVQHRPAEAAAAYQKVIALNPGDVDVYLFASLALVESRQYDEAIETLQRARGYTDDTTALRKIDGYIMKIEKRRTEVSDAK
jgi:tetratricopeptide (TPR) repeat protein